MNKVMPRLELLEKNEKNIDAINRKYHVEGVRALSDDELLLFIRHTRKATRFDYSILTDEELYRIAASDDGGLAMEV